MENTKELSDMKTEAEELLRQVTIISFAAIVPVLPPNRKVILEGMTTLTIKICDVFQIDSDSSSVNKWISSIFDRQFPTTLSAVGGEAVYSILIKRKLDFGKALIDVCCKVKYGEISQDDFWGKKGINIMKSQLLKKHT